MRAPTRYRRHKRGLSLAELMISIVILALLSVLLVGVIPATILGLRSASERATATLLVQAAMEQTRKQHFDSIAPISFVRELNNRTYTVTTEVNPALAADGSDLDVNQVKAIRVRVEWEAKGGTKVETFDTIVARSPH